MSEESDGNVIEFRAGIKLRQEGRRLERRYAAKCRHAQVILDPSLATLECEQCHEAISPVWWLNEWMREVDMAIGLRRQAEGDRNRLLEQVEELRKERTRLQAAIRRAKS